MNINFAKLNTNQTGCALNLDSLDVVFNTNCHKGPCISSCWYFWSWTYFLYLFPSGYQFPCILLNLKGPATLAVERLAALKDTAALCLWECHKLLPYSQGIDCLLLFLGKQLGEFRHHSHSRQMRPKSNFLPICNLHPTFSWQPKQPSSNQSPSNNLICQFHMWY